MSEAQQMWDAARAIAKAFHNDPAVKAYYKELARQNRIKQEAEEAAYEARRAAEAEERRRSKAYDAYVSDGGSDPCFQAGHRGHCGSSDCSLYDEETHSCPYASAEDFGFPKAGETLSGLDSRDVAQAATEQTKNAPTHNQGEAE